MSSLRSVSRARAEATAFAPSLPRCPQGRNCSSAASSCPAGKVGRHSEGKEIGGLAEGTGTGIWAGGFFGIEISRKPPRESKTRKHITRVEAVREHARMSWAWDFMVGCVHWRQLTVASKHSASTSPWLSLINTKKLIRTEMDKMDGVGLQAQPQVGGGRQQAGSQKATRSAAEAPGPGSCHPDSTSAAPAPFVGRGPWPGPGPRHRLPAEGEDSFQPSSAPKGPPGPWPKRLP